MSPATEERLRTGSASSRCPLRARPAARRLARGEAALAERGPGDGGLRRCVLPAFALRGGASSWPGGRAHARRAPRWADWIGDRFADRADPAAPAFAGLPAGGSVLTISRTGAYAIDPDGRLAVARRHGRRLVAARSPRGGCSRPPPDGRRSDRNREVDAGATAPGAPPVLEHRARHAVAYLEGATLRVVAGTGDPSTDRGLRRGAAAVTPAWRPRSDRVLSHATAGGVIETLDVVTGRTLASAERSVRRVRRGVPPAGPARRARLVAKRSPARRALVTFGHGSGCERSRSANDRAARGRARARASPVGQAGRGGGRRLGRGRGRRGCRRRGRRGAAVRACSTSHCAARAGRDSSSRATWPGSAWSRDGRRLLLAWRDADQWLLLGPGGRVRRALHGVSGELGAAGGFPRVAGWCCRG